MNINEHRRKVLRKLGFVKSEGGKHEKWQLKSSSSERSFLTTTVSRNSKDIGPGLLKKYCVQLCITKDQYQRIASCNMSKEDYYDYLLEKNVIDNSQLS